MAAMQRCLSANVDCCEREDALAMRASKLGASLLVVLPQQPLAFIGRKQQIWPKAKEHDALLELFFAITRYCRGEHVTNFA